MAINATMGMHIVINPGGEVRDYSDCWYRSGEEPFCLTARSDEARLDLRGVCLDKARRRFQPFSISERGPRVRLSSGSAARHGCSNDRLYSASPHLVFLVTPA